MKLNFIIEICVGITIAILGVAYPIIIDRISNIGEKYSSNYLSEIFKKEHSQNVFKPLLIATIISFLFLIFKLKPLFGWNNWFINNSSYLLTFSLSLFLVFYFFLWISKVLLYNGRSIDLLTYLIEKYKKKNDNVYLLKTINEIAYYSIKNQDEHIQETLVKFYSNEFVKFRRDHDKSKPVIYPFDFYQVIYKIISEIKNHKNYKLPVLENRVVSADWILGGGFDKIKLSEETFQWLWSYNNLIADNTKFIRLYWAKASQYFRYNLDYIQGNYDYENMEYTNQIEINERDKERENFLEFHYALGGLLLFKENYIGIKDCFNFTQSWPPEYVLLPNNMSEIFIRYVKLMNEHNTEFIEFKYPFLDLNDNFGNELRYWISCYMVLLFIRQFTLHPFMTYHDFISQPQLPEKISDLNNWLRKIPFFKKCLKDVIVNKDLIDKLGFTDKLVENEKTNFLFLFVDELESKIKEKIKLSEINIEPSIKKIELFEKSSGELICKAFKDYSIIQNETDLSSISGKRIYGINGINTLYPKEAFSDDVDFLGFDTSVAYQISNQKIKYLLPNSFLLSRSVNYLFEKDKLIEAIEKLEITDNHVIVVFDPLFDIIEKLKENFGNQVVELPTTSRIVRNTIFILSKADLPYVHFKDLSEEEITANKLEKLKTCQNIYASVLDMNSEENNNLKEKWVDGGRQDELEKQVQICISFIAQIIWKNNIDVVQINIKTPFIEQGIPNKVSDIIPFEKTQNN